jgi:lamin tail-like protein/CotH protein
MFHPSKCTFYLVIFLCLTACRGNPENPKPANVVISEIMYSPETETPCGEFVEILNTEKQDVSLEGWSFDAGIRFQFPKDAKIKAGQQMVVSSRSCPVKAMSFGTFKGRLDNDGETIRLVDGNSKLVDEVVYDDERGWPRRAKTDGRSLERVHPDMPSSFPGSWDVGPVGGTPSKSNKVRTKKALPLIVQVTQSPVVPTTGQAVTFQACVLHVDPLKAVSVRYKLEGETTLKVAAMHPAEAQQCLKSGGVSYRGTLPPFDAKGVVEFRIEAVAEDQTTGKFPRGSGSPFAYFAVDDSRSKNGLPRIRVVITKKDAQTFASRSQHSNGLLPCSVIEGGRIHYNVGLRLRGLSSRSSANKDYRLDFSQNSSLDGPRKMNITCNKAGNEYIGLLGFKALGMVVTGGEPVSLLLGDKFLPHCLNSERVTRDLVRRHFKEASGDVYKGISQVLPKDRTSDPKEELRKYREQGVAGALLGKETMHLLDGRFDDRGPEHAMYRFSYLRIVGSGKEDLSPIVKLSKVMSRAPGKSLIRELSQLVDVDQWVRYFAARQVLGDGEHGLHSRQGIDYFIYRDPSDGRQHLIPWDFDQVLARHDIPIHHHRVRGIMRFLRHPQVAPKYAAAIVEMIQGPLSIEAMGKIIQKAAPILSIEKHALLNREYERIADSNIRQIPRVLSADANLKMTSRLPIGEEIWAPSCAQWDDPVHKMPRCEGGTTGHADEKREIQFTQNFIVPAAEIVSAARFSLVLKDMFWKNILIASKGFFKDRTATISLKVNGESLQDMEDEVARIESEETQVQVNIPEGLLKSENTMVMSIAAPRSFMSRAMSLFQRRLVVPMLELEVTWDGGAAQSVLLSGQADATRTRSVYVDGLDAGYVPWRGRWFFKHSIKNPVECLDIQARDENEKVIETLRVGLVGSSKRDQVNTCPHGQETPQKWIVY